MNSLAKYMQAFGRIAKDAIHKDLCPIGMGVSVNIENHISQDKFVRCPNSLVVAADGDSYDYRNR